MDYSEEQRIRSPFVFIVFTISTIVAFAGVIMGMYQNNAEGDELYTIIWVPLLLVLIETLVFFLLFRTTLETNVSGSGFTFRYFPFIRSAKTISFNAIKEWRIRKLRSVREFGGYGYKRRAFSKRTGLIMGGDDALELNLNDGSVIVVSTANAYMLASAMKKYAAEKEIQNGQGN